MLKNIPIKIAIKIKPCQLAKYVQITSNESEKVLSLRDPLNIGNQLQVKVDFVHDANTTQQSVYQNCQLEQFMAKFIQGYNVTVVVYGQTGSGKTFAMEGPYHHLKQNKSPQKNDINKFKASERGLIPDCIHYLFSKIDEKAMVSCSCVQLYNEKIYDLLNDKGLQTSLKMRWEMDRDFIVEDLQQKQCKSEQSLFETWQQSRSNRITSWNKIHQLSSRSHSLFTIHLEDFDQENNYRSRFLTFVDLAGSQRITDLANKLSKQSIQINKSLFFLRKIIKILEQNTESKRNVYVPYRDSKLTSLLKKSLGGNCITLMIACIEADQKHMEETISTLSYAVSAGKINNRVGVQLDKQAQEIKFLKQGNNKLSKELQLARKQVESFQNLFNNNQTNKQVSQQLVESISTVRQLLQANKELREELDRQKQTNEKQQSQINQLMLQNKNYKNTIRRNSKREQITLQERFRTEPKHVRPSPVARKNSYFSQSIKAEEKQQIQREQYFKSASKASHRIRPRNSVPKKQQYKLIEDVNANCVNLTKTFQ